MKTKVAIVTNIMAPYRIPLFNLLNKFEQLDIIVYLLAENEKNRLWSMENYLDFNYKVLPDYGTDLSNHIKFICHFNPHIVTEIQKEKFDVVICAGYDSVTAMLIFIMVKIKKIPLLFWSGSTAYENNSKLRIIGKPIIKLFSKYCDGFIAYGSRAEQFLINNGASKNRIFKAFNTVDIEYYKNESKKYENKKLNILNDNHIKNTKCILYVGQLIERKGVKTLIDAFKDLAEEVDDVSLLIIGEGKHKQEYIDYCYTNYIKDIYFLGNKSIEEIPKYYSIADLFVLPSSSEVWGLVINEAMASGLPIVTTDSVGASEDLVINDVNGYVVKAGNVSELKKAMKTILVDDDLKYNMKEQSLGIINNFSIKKSAEGIINAINSLFE